LMSTNIGMKFLKLLQSATYSKASSMVQVTGMLRFEMGIEYRDMYHLDGI